MNNPYKRDNEIEDEFNKLMCEKGIITLKKLLFEDDKQSYTLVTDYSKIKSFILNLRHSDRECYKQEMLEKIENHHTSELKILQESNNKETTKEYISKGLEIYKDSLISLLNEEVTK